MTRDEFDALVNRIERRLGSRPWALRLRIAIFVAVGYAAFLSWFLLLALLGGLFYAGALAVDTGLGLVFLVLGAVLLTVGGLQAVYFLWVRLAPAPGYALQPSQSPRLFELMAALRRELKSARFHRVLILPDFNAGAHQVPRLGVFGWPRNFLYIGLPLLDALTPEEFEAVLAHEFAHLSARHGRFTTWIYRMRQTWERLFQELHRPVKSDFGRTVRKGLLVFIDWYWPRFNAGAFVLSRANEYAADRFAAEWAGADHFAGALWRIGCQARRLDQKLWPELWQMANSQPEPPSDATARLFAALATPPDFADAIRWTEQAACSLTDNQNTHPSLSDRLRALDRGVDRYRRGGFPAAPSPSAAAALFGNQLDAVRQAVDSLWRTQVAETWRNRHGRAVSQEQRLATLDRVGVGAEPDPDLLWEKAVAVLDLEGPAAAEPLVRQLLAIRPTHSAANLVLGQYLLERGNTEGELHLRRILEREEDELIPHACEALAHHFQSAGLAGPLEETRRRLSQFQAAQAAAGRERNTVSAADRFLPHDLAPHELAALQKLLAQEPELVRAHLARKDLKHFPHERLFVLSVQTEANLWGRSRSERDATLVSRLVPLVELPGRVLVVSPQGGFRKLARKIARVPNSQVYPAMP